MKLLALWAISAVAFAQMPIKPAGPVAPRHRALPQAGAPQKSRAKIKRAKPKKVKGFKKGVGRKMKKGSK
jgi:hypothetical protein